MKKVLFIFSGVLVLLIGAIYLLQPRRTICGIMPRSLTLDTVRSGEFIESIPFTGKISHDSTSRSVVAWLDQLYLSRVPSGLNASTRINAIDYDLKVVHVDTAVIDGKFQITLTADDSTLEIMRQRENIRMRLFLSEARIANLISVGGFYKDSGGKYVYVVLPDQKVVKRNIVLGRKNPEYLEVISGLTVGDVVITSSYENFNSEEDFDLAIARKRVESQ